MECSPSLLCKLVFALILYLEMFSGPRSENKTDTNGNATNNNEPSKQFFLHVVLEHPKTKKPIHLLGTNHVSKSAEEEVRKAVKELKPDTIVLELSSERLGLLTMPWPPSEFRFQYTQPIRSSLSYFYYKLGTILGVRPGGEFFAAFTEGKKQKARIILGDRNFDVTSSRIYRTITPTEIISSLPFLFTFAWDMARFVRMTRQYDKGLLTRDQIEALVNDELTSQESFEKTMDDNEKMPPSVKKSMITERDQYIASVLRECTGDKIVGVFGGAHIEGIKKHLYDVVKDENEFRRKLEAVPDHTIYSAYDLLPKEILQLISGHLDNRTKLKLRTINKSCFKSTDLVGFPIYLPRSNTLPLIFDHLGRYNNPISLTINKPCGITLKEFIDQIARLSNLTSLTFPYFSEFDLSCDPTEQPNWLLLTKLSNITDITLSKPKTLSRDLENAPEELLHALIQLPHLVTLDLTRCNYTSHILDIYLPMLTSLENLSASMTPELDVLSSLSPHLTRLCFVLPPVEAIPGHLNGVNIGHSLKVLKIVGGCTVIEKISLSAISSLESLEISAKNITGLDNNNKLSHLSVAAHNSAVYDQIRKLKNLEWLQINMSEENTDQFFFSNFTRLTHLGITMRHNYELWNISNSVKNLELQLDLSNFNYASLSVLTSLDSLSTSTMHWHEQKTDYLAEVSSLIGLTSLYIASYAYLQLANLSTLTNLEQLQVIGCLSLETSFLVHLTKLKSFSNFKLTPDHFTEIAPLTRLTHLAYLIDEDELKGFNVDSIAHLPLKIFAAEIYEGELDSLLNAARNMTSLELLALSEKTQKYFEKEQNNDWAVLSSLTHLTRLDLDMVAPPDALTSLTRVTSLQYIFTKMPDIPYYSTDEDDGADDKPEDEPATPVDEWKSFVTKFPNLVAASYTGSSVYSDPWSVLDFDDKYQKLRYD